MASRRLCRDHLSPLFACCSRSIWLPFSSSEYLHRHCFFSKHTFSTAIEQTEMCNSATWLQNRWRKRYLAWFVLTLGRAQWSISAGCPHEKVHLQCEPRATGAADARRRHVWQMIWGMDMMVATDGFFIRSHALSVWKSHRNRNCSCTDRGPIRNYFCEKKQQFVYVLIESFPLLAKSPM